MLSSVWKCIWQTISLLGIADCCYDVWRIDVNVRWSNMIKYYDDDDVDDDDDDDGDDDDEDDNDDDIDL